MELREIQTFLRVAHLKSFSKAARELGYSQAAVTIQIHNLEQELDTRLFDRIGRQTLMTHSGEVFHRHASNIMKELASAKTALTEGHELSGTLAIGAIESICASVFPPLIEEYHKKHPDVTVSIVLDSPDALLDLLGKNTLDLVYLLDQRIYDPRWVKALEEPEQIVFAAAASHPMARKASLTLDEAIAQPFILTEKDASYRFALDQYLAACGKTLRPFLEIGNTEFIIEQLKNGCGLSFLPEFTIRSCVTEGSIAALAVEDFQMRGWRQILYHKDKWVSREMEAFIELAGGKTG